MIVERYDDEWKEQGWVDIAFQPSERDVEDYEALRCPSKLLSRVAFLGYNLKPPHDDYILSTPNSAEIALKAAALQVPRPSSQRGDSRVPVDGVVNKQCQEWTMDYLQCLVSHGYLDSSVMKLAQEQRDLPTHGVMLRKSGSSS
ncbi:hypothetical protein N0V88_007200 [Collariella sp. IMI 366227]|nr:hypothetical protein N0V88_007200 [Collariella sp. IMI 366227]